MAKEFRQRESEDFVIVEDGQIVGSVRVKPSGILWSPKGSHSWFRLSIEAFGAHAVEHGTKQAK